MKSCPSIESRPGCIKSALAIVGEKWTALILSNLSDSAKTFSDIEVLVDGINPRILSQRLDKLAHAGIIERKQYQDHPPRSHYELTDKGRELQKVLVAMAEWGNKYYKPAA